MGQEKCIQDFDEETEGKKETWEDNIILYIKEIGQEGVY